MASGRPGRNAALRGMKQRREGGREGGRDRSRSGTAGLGLAGRNAAALGGGGGREGGREGGVFGRRCNNQTTCWLPWHAGTPAGGLGCSHEHT